MLFAESFVHAYIHVLVLRYMEVTKGHSHISHASGEYGYKDTCNKTTSDKNRRKTLEWR